MSSAAWKIWGRGGLERTQPRLKMRLAIEDSSKTREYLAQNDVSLVIYSSYTLTDGTWKTWMEWRDGLFGR